MKRFRARWPASTVFAIALFSLGLWTATVPVIAQSFPQEVLAYPDQVVHNGKIVTMDDRSRNPVPGRIVKAMAIRSGQILKLGNDEEILRLAGPQTRRIDLKGRTVIPGLVDTHSHIHDAADHRELPGIAPEIVVAGSTPEELVRNFEVSLKEAIRKAKQGEWIRLNLSPEAGYELVMYQRKLTRRELDRMAPDNPVLVAVRTIALVNGKAIETVEENYRAKIVDEALDRETGIAIYGTEFLRAVPVLLLQDRLDVLTEIVRQELEEWASFGVTTYSSHINVPAHVNAFAELDRKQLMPIRFAWTHRSGTIFNADSSSFYTRIGDLAGSGSPYWWNIGSTTGQLDHVYPGVATTISARPEVKAREINLGEPGNFKRQVMFDMVRSGLRITGTHIAGDLAVDNFLDIIEEGSKASGMTPEQIREKAHVIDHCTLGPRPDQYERLKRLNITMSCGPKYIPSLAPRVLKDYGERYLEWNVPMKSLIDAGVKTVWEQDEHPKTSSFYYLELPITRKAGDGKVYAPDQRLDRVIALKTATSWASEYVMRSDVLGTLEAGKWADFLILNRDYFTVPEDDISEVRPLMTVVGGKFVYLDRALASELGLKPAGAQREPKL